MNHRSNLLDLKYFDMCQGELVPDIMHDLLEGVLQNEVKRLILYCTGKHFFPLDYLNHKIQSLELCYGMEGDRPAPIDRKVLSSESNLLKQKGIVNAPIERKILLEDLKFLYLAAIQMWVLGRFLPIMIGQCIPEDDDNWNNYLKLLQITDFLVAPKISTDELAYLKILIDEHHVTFALLYSDAITPKFHFLIHVPRLISK